MPSSSGCAHSRVTPLRGWRAGPCGLRARMALRLIRQVRGYGQNEYTLLSSSGLSTKRVAAHRVVADLAFPDSHGYGKRVVGVHPNHIVSAGGESRASGVPIHLLTQFVLMV